MTTHCTHQTGKTGNRGTGNRDTHSNTDEKELFIYISKCMSVSPYACGCVSARHPFPDSPIPRITTADVHHRP